MSLIKRLDTGCRATEGSFSTFSLAKFENETYQDDFSIYVESFACKRDLLELDP